MFISPAFAQDAAAAPSPFLQLAPFVLIFVVIYFLIIRPQQRKVKEHKAMLEALRRGDRIVTGGGIIGTIAKVGQDDELSVEVSEGIRIKVLRSSVQAVLAKPEPAKGKRRQQEEEEEDDDHDDEPDDEFDDAIDQVDDLVDDRDEQPKKRGGGLGSLFGRK